VPAAPPSTPAASNGGVKIVVDPVGLRPGDSLFARAYAEHARGNLDAAADLYEKAIQHPPVAPEAYNNYGALLASRGKYQAAITMYDLGLRANRQDPRLWINLGDAYKADGRHADALSAFFEAARLDPSSIPVKVRLANEYAAISDTANARRGYEDALRLAPKDPEAHFAYGSFLQKQRDYRGAVKEFQAFIDLAPGRYPQDAIERVRAYVSSLRKQFP
jgi:tetratricopeptide (TPR) repeat protein